MGGDPVRCCAAGCQIKSLKETAAQLGVLYDAGDDCHRGLLAQPGGNPSVDMACMITIGFLIYGPVMLIGLHTPGTGTEKAASTAAGFTGLFGYLGGSVAASAIVGFYCGLFRLGWRFWCHDWRQCAR